MSRKRPVCAWCGESLVKSGAATIQIQYTTTPGKPEVGWHAGGTAKGCFRDDPVVTTLNLRNNVDEPGDAVIAKALADIHDRGQGRVVANKGSALFRGVG